LRATRSKELCSIYNGHAATKLENAIIKYLGEFSNPIKVREYLAIAERQVLEQYEAELKGIEKRLADLDDQFLHQLYDLLRRKVLTEQEFARANEAARNQKAELEKRQVELSQQLEKARVSEKTIERVPRIIKTFLEALQSLEPRQQKAQLQTILKAAHIYNDGKIELEFRE
jgi:hypothetical protein